MSSTYPHRARAAQILIFCCACWAFSFPAMKALALVGERNAPGNSSVFYAALCVVVRFSIASVLLALLCGRSLLGLTRKELIQGAGLGFFGGLGLVLQMDGMSYTHASTAAFLTQGYCIWIPIWFALRHGRLPSLTVWVSSLLVLVGAALLAGVDWHHFQLGRGEWENLAGSVLFAGQILWLDRRDFVGNDVKRFSLVMFGTMLLTCLPLALATAAHPADLFRAYASGPALGLLGLLVVVCTLLSFLLANRWQPEVPATEASLLYCTEPVFTSLVTLFLPQQISNLSGIQYANEHLTWNLVAGGGVILAANVWLQLRAKG
ncbi:MAG TPA: EamA family transporter [Candidatus Limnocylindria bacterium]|nr:EamA family transporter [Candidatus Limnocylindria bacterium]